MAFPNQYYSGTFIPSPCKHCTVDTGRHPGCHAQCESYISYRVAMDEKNEKIRKARADFYEPAIRKNTKKMRMKGSKHGEV